MCFGKGPGGLLEVVEDIEQRDTSRRSGRGREAPWPPRGSSGPGARTSISRAVDADPRTFRQVPCELALAAADVEDRRQALGEQATSHPAVHVLAARVAAEDRPCQAEALGSRS